MLNEKITSKRHAFVKRMVLLTFLMTGIFGLSSVMYALAQAKYSSNLEQERSLKALKTTLSIDKKYLIRELQESSSRCHIENVQSCYDLLTNITKTRNRLEDYSIILRKSLHLEKGIELIASIEAAREMVDELTEELFGLSMSKANELRIRTIEEYITFIDKHQKNIATERESNEKRVELEKVVTEMHEEIDNAINSNESIEKDTLDLYKWFRSVFWILISSQILLNLSVYFIDLITNNADPEAANEFTYKKVFPKVKPLALTYLLAIVAMISAQSLLHRQGEINMINHCRELNKQNIGFINTLNTYNNSTRSLGVISGMIPTKYCSNLINPIISENLSEFENYQTSDQANRIEVISMILRIYADGYQERVSALTQGTQTILFFILILNVASMTSMSVFLWFDSADIG